MKAIRFSKIGCVEGLEFSQKSLKIPGKVLLIFLVNMVMILFGWVH